MSSRLARDSAVGVCPDCDGPSRTFKGNVHKWRCIDCIELVVGADRPPTAPPSTELANPVVREDILR